MEDLMLQQAESVEEKVLVQSFEEVIGEIDKEIKKYDSKSFASPSFGDSTRKENYVGHPRINEANMPCTPTHVAHLSPSTCVPLAEIPSFLVNHVHVEDTWKRLTRIGVVLDVGMSEAVGEKRSAGNTTNQTKLPKKKEGFPRRCNKK